MLEAGEWRRQNNQPRGPNNQFNYSWEKPKLKWTEFWPNVCAWCTLQGSSNFLPIIPTHKANDKPPRLKNVFGFWRLSREWKLPGKAGREKLAGRMGSSKEVGITAVLGLIPGISQVTLRLCMVGCDSEADPWLCCGSDRGSYERFGTCCLLAAWRTCFMWVLYTLSRRLICIASIYQGANHGSCK